MGIHDGRLCVNITLETGLVFIAVDYDDREQQDNKKKKKEDAERERKKAVIYNLLKRQDLKTKIIRRVHDEGWIPREKLKDELLSEIKSKLPNDNVSIFFH